MIPLVLTIALTCWLCALIVAPPKSPPGFAVEQRVYAHLLGRHHRLTLLAIALTGVALFAFVATLPPHLSLSAVADRTGGLVCTQPLVGHPTCYTRQADGEWAQEVLRDDGMWQAFGEVLKPDPSAFPMGG